MFEVIRNGGGTATHLSWTVGGPITCRVEEVCCASSHGYYAELSWLSYVVYNIEENVFLQPFLKHTESKMLMNVRSFVML